MAEDSQARSAFLANLIMSSPWIPTASIEGQSGGNEVLAGWSSVRGHRASTSLIWCHGRSDSRSFHFDSRPL